MRNTLTAIILAIVVTGCTQVTNTNTLSPSPVDVTVSTGAPPVEPEPEVAIGANVTIQLSPAPFTVEVGKNVNVTVTVRDKKTGREVESSNIFVDITDTSVIAFVQRDGRILMFNGVSLGETDISVMASGVTAETIGTVIP